MSRVITGHGFCSTLTGKASPGIVAGDEPEEGKSLLFP